MIILYTNVRTTKEFIWRYTNELYLMELLIVYTTSNGTVATARQLATIIKRDVELGKWNLYDGGKSNTRTAKCRYSKKRLYLPFTHVNLR